MASRGTFALVAPLLLCASFARADAIDPPPPRCPTGSEGDSSHCGPVCAPRTCLSVSECRIGETCAARDLCIRPSSCGPGDVEGECAPGCTSGLMCTSVFVCVPGTTPADAGRRDTGVPASDGGDDPSRYRTSYCSCAVPSAPTSPRWLALGAAALGCAIAIRRRR